MGLVSKARGDGPRMLDTLGGIGLEAVRQRCWGGKKEDQYLCLSESLKFIMRFLSLISPCPGLDKLQLSNSPTDPESGKLSANGHQKTL